MCGGGGGIWKHFCSFPTLTPKLILNPSSKLNTNHNSIPRSNPSPNLNPDPNSNPKPIPETDHKLILTVIITGTQTQAPDHLSITGLNVGTHLDNYCGKGGGEIYLIHTWQNLTHRREEASCCLSHLPGVSLTHLVSPSLSNRASFCFSI